jgi:cystathionine beta-lyase/cystathionine gamma-synthase
VNKIFFHDFRATMTHETLRKEERYALGIHDNFLRVSIGLEDADDLIADLDQALKKAVSKK